MSDTVPTARLINHWKDTLTYQGHLLQSATKILVQATVDDLEELERLREEQASARDSSS